MPGGRAAVGSVSFVHASTEDTVIVGVLFWLVALNREADTLVGGVELSPLLGGHAGESALLDYFELRSSSSALRSLADNSAGERRYSAWPATEQTPSSIPSSHRVGLPRGSRGRRT